MISMKLVLRVIRVTEPLGSYGLSLYSDRRLLRTASGAVQAAISPQ